MSARAVLVVDDDPFIRKLVSTTLEDVANFDLHQAADGIEAIEAAERVQPAVVFLDIDMPRMDGITCCRELRARLGPASEPTIVMLTAAGGDDVEAEARAAGADLFLTKPFSPLDLLRLVDELGGR
ncbi:MAG TPA: response regulator [Baekduia sp.]|nr:response regulator [Baekduia sp.]